MSVLFDKNFFVTVLYQYLKTRLSERKNIGSFRLQPITPLILPWKSFYNITVS